MKVLFVGGPMHDKEFEINFGNERVTRIDYDGWAYTRGEDIGNGQTLFVALTSPAKVGLNQRRGKSTNPPQEKVIN